VNTVERSAKTVEQAIEDALKALDTTKEQADIIVLDEGAKGGLFGIGSRPAVVKVSVKEDPMTIVKTFLREVTLSMGLSVELEVKQKERRMYVDFMGENLGILIGKRGQTIDSLQYLTNLVLNGRGIREVNVILDTGNYRKRRRDTLEALARSVARKIKDGQKRIELEPMSRFERHIIHTTLQNDKFVKTSSEGDEPNRYVIAEKRHGK